MSNEREQFLWVEKYRPKKIDDCVLPDNLKATFKEFVAAGQIPNLLLSGTAGVGKTTVAKALCDEIGADWLLLNASEDSRIDVLRGRIRDFASTVSLTNSGKVVILDEADYADAARFQPALRGFIEEFANNCRFVLTCNFKNRIIEPLHSRCSIVEFAIPPAEKPKMLAKFMARAKYILDSEGVTFNKEAVARLLVRHFPDFRRVLNELQRYSSSGTIDEGVLIDTGNANIVELVKHLKAQSFTEMRKWVAANTDNDFNQVIRQIYDQSHTLMDVQSQAALVLILGEYQYKMAFVADQELNLVAMLTEIMGSCTFK